jgi:hypothetical protein
MRKTIFDAKDEQAGRIVPTLMISDETLLFAFNQGV